MKPFEVVGLADRYDSRLRETLKYSEKSLGFGVRQIWDQILVYQLFSIQVTLGKCPNLSGALVSLSVKFREPICKI